MISTYQSTPLYRNEKFLRDRYLEKQLSLGQIAREIRSARSTILAGLRRYEIPIRSEDEAHKLNKGQLAYGERMVNGKIVPHKGERRILGKIVELREMGHSYGQIALWLNTNKVLTKNRAAKWDRPTIYKLVKKERGTQSLL